MDELVRCTLTKDYIRFGSSGHQYNDQLVALCNHMMEVDVNKRAKIKDVICNPLIIVDYYHSYFQFGA